jgi:hypothetical protein
VRCSGQRISAITVYSSAPTVAWAKRIPGLADVVREFHVTTRPDIVRGFLLMDVGDACTELRRSESERILRAQPFLADATIQAFPDDSGSVALEVRTIDESSLVAGAHVSSDLPFLSGLRLGSSNLNGGGVYLAGNWRDGGAYRTGYGLKFLDYQWMGRPYVLWLEGSRLPLGSDWRTEASHPFLTDLQRIAWKASAGASSDFVQFEPVKDESHGVNLERRFFDVGGILRLGPPGRLSLFGASITGDHEIPDSTSVLITDDGFRPDTSTVLRDRYQPHRIARVNALWGVRDIGFVRVRGFDALTGTQDLPVGFQVGTLFGRSLTVLGSKDDDVFMAADLYVGSGGPNAALRVQLQGEGRRSNDQTMWDGVLTNGRAAEYIRFGESHTAIVSAEWSGGWRQRVPFRLTLGAAEGGLRGYHASTDLGGQRAIGRIEDRYVLGRPLGLGDLGVAWFTDAGRLWAGDVPYGTTTRLRESVGISILGAVPPRSTRIWRLDIALPLSSGTGGHGLEFRISSSDNTTFFWREPSDVTGARERTLPSSIFSWP